MSTRKQEILYRAQKEDRIVELVRKGGRLVLSTHNRETGSTSSISIIDPWYTPTPRIPARPS